MSISKLTLDPVFETVKYGSTDELPSRQAMLDAGTYVDAQDSTGSRLLHYAVLRGLSRFAIDLIVIGAHVNAKDADGCAALHHAARLGNRFLVVDLIAAGADVNAKDGEGRTPLHHAVLGLARDEYEDHAAICRGLMRNGADPCEEDARRTSPCGLLRKQTGHLPHGDAIAHRFPGN